MQAHMEFLLCNLTEKQKFCQNFGQIMVKYDLYSYQEDLFLSAFIVKITFIHVF